MNAQHCGGERELRGSPHVHGLAWLPDTPDVEEILASSEDGDDTAKEELIRHVDSIVTTLNPAILPDGSLCCSWMSTALAHACLGYSAYTQ